MKKCYEFFFKGNRCQIYYHNKLVVITSLVNSMYFLNLDNGPMMNSILNKHSSNGLNPKHLWHLRFSHAKDIRIRKLKKDRLIGLFGEEHYSTCESCILGKMAKNSFNRHVK